MGGRISGRGTSSLFGLCWISLALLRKHVLKINASFVLPDWKPSEKLYSRLFRSNASYVQVNTNPVLSVSSISSKPSSREFLLNELCMLWANYNIDFGSVPIFPFQDNYSYGVCTVNILVRLGECLVRTMMQPASLPVQHERQWRDRLGWRRVVRSILIRWDQWSR